MAHGGRQGQRLVGTGGANVGELLALGRIDRKIVAATVQANDLPLVHIDVGLDKHTTPVLQVEQGKTQGLALHHGHQHTITALRDFSVLYRSIVIEHVGQDAGAGGHGEKHGAETYQATSRDNKLQPNPALAVRHHICQLCPAQTQLFHHRALVLLLAIDNQLLEGFVHLAVDFFLDHLWPRYTQLEALSTHIFDQYREV